MTKREMYESIVNGKVTDEVVEMVKAEIAKLDAVNAKAEEKKAAKAAENAPLFEAALAIGSDGTTAAAFGEEQGITTQKASYILRTLAAEGKLTSEDGTVGKKTCKVYHIA